MAVVPAAPAAPMLQLEEHVDAAAYRRWRHAKRTSRPRQPALSLERCARDAERREVRAVRRSKTRRRKKQRVRERGQRDGAHALRDDVEGEQPRDVAAVATTVATASPTTTVAPRGVAGADEWVCCEDTDPALLPVVTPWWRRWWFWG